MSKINIAAILVMASALGAGVASFALRPRAPQATTVVTSGEEEEAETSGSGMSMEDLLARSPGRKTDTGPASTKPSYFELQLAQEPLPQPVTNASALGLPPNLPVEQNAPTPTLRAASLTLDARFLLDEKGSAHRQQIEATLRSFDDERFRSDPKMALTAENYTRLSEALRKIDPEFQAEWREVLLQNHPGLEQMLPPEKR